MRDDETDVSLSCEMSLYLRPDRNLLWFRGGQQIMNTGRHIITYTDGDGTGQFGGNIIGSSRVSTLVITEPQLSDSGTYTCAIRNTEHSHDIELTVESAAAGQYSITICILTLSCNMMLSGGDDNTTDPTVDPTTANNVTLIIIYSSSGAALLVIAILMMVAVLCIAAAFRRGKR